MSSASEGRFSFRAGGRCHAAWALLQLYAAWALLYCRWLLYCLSGGGWRLLYWRWLLGLLGLGKPSISERVGGGGRWAGWGLAHLVLLLTLLGLSKQGGGGRWEHAHLVLQHKVELHVDELV